MSKKTNSSCLDLPLHNINQKIYDLGSNFCIALIEVSIENPRQLQLHIKLVERETKRFICFDKVFLLELVRQLRQFESANIVYPCAAARDIGLSIKATTNPGEYQLTFEKTKLILDPTTVKYIILHENKILNTLRDIENHHSRGGYDVVG